jgi:hypothetical protein
VVFLVVDVSAAGLALESDDELSVDVEADEEDEAESPLPFDVPALLASDEDFFG